MFAVGYRTGRWYLRGVYLREQRDGEGFVLSMMLILARSHERAGRGRGWLRLVNTGQERERDDTWAMIELGHGGRRRDHNERTRRLFLEK